MKINILVVDDIATNIIAICEAIMNDQIHIFTASTGEEALELLIRHDFGLAIIDVEMPGMTGLELARLVRGIRRFEDMPIIFATARPAESSLIFQSYKSGAVDILFKPLNVEVLRSKVNIFVELAMKRQLLAQKIIELEQATEVIKRQSVVSQMHDELYAIALAVAEGASVSKERALAVVTSIQKSRHSSDLGEMRAEDAFVRL